eukprot:6880298-Heterocapsa_arctica.AAC.1
MKSTIWRLKKSAKRKATPSWSCPSEILLLALCPSYCSVGEAKLTGIGGTTMQDFAGGDLEACNEELQT